MCSDPAVSPSRITWAIPVIAAGSDFENMEWQGRSSGPMLVPPPVEESQPPQPTQLVIEEPPWVDELRRGDLDVDDLAASTGHQPDELSALEQMKVDGGDVPEPGAWQPPVESRWPHAWNRPARRSRQAHKRLEYVFTERLSPTVIGRSTFAHTTLLDWGLVEAVLVLAIAGI